MQVIHGLEQVEPPFTRSVLTIGNFDGVHRAHQRLLARCRELADAEKTPSVALTFEPHPLTVVAPHVVPPCLTPQDEKLTLLDRSGVDLAVVARSEPGLLRMEAEDFVENVVRRKFSPLHVVEGPSFGFGKGRRGTPRLLQELGASFGCQVHILEPLRVRLDGEEVMVSSSMIRAFLERGRVSEAAECLGRNYVLIGRVVHGDARGRILGFPTANVEVENQLIPGDGVYAGRSQTDGAAYLSAISIGSAATFGGSRRRVEVHLLKFRGDLHGKTLRVEFAGFLRPQQRFQSTEALVEQIERDVRSTGKQETKWTDSVIAMASAPAEE